ncbi:integrase core domain-containing protein [Nocardia fluminea]|uniref:integrase core domain-containing protein n=1 Tax=Nocardia fluminea TaxID=134984 RepID=UPI0037A2C9A3
MDNGTEITVHAMRDWGRFTGVDASIIDPGSPWQNGVCESSNGRFRDEFLSCEVYGLIIASHYAVALASGARRSVNRDGWSL